MRLHIAPYLGCKRLDKLTVRDLHKWLTKLATVCVPGVFAVWLAYFDASATANE